MIFTHNHILFIFPTIHTKCSKSRTHIKQGTSWSLHSHEPFFLFHSSTNYCDEDINLGIKTKPQHSSGLPKNSSENPARTVQKQSQKIQPKLSENSPKNSVHTIRKQSQKFSPDCLKTVPKFQPGLSENIPKNS